MPLNDNQRLVIEAIKSMLDDDAKLGLKQHDYESDERGYEYLHNHIDDMFHVKAAGLLHSAAICATFTKVHNFKYLDHPKFWNTMDAELRSIGVPGEEVNKAKRFYEEILKEMQDDVWKERDSGYNPDLGEVLEQPEQPLDFTIHDNNLSKSNVKWEKGVGSPSRTPSGK